jgi:hypothetical protein
LIKTTKHNKLLKEKKGEGAVRKPTIEDLEGLEGMLHPDGYHK